MEFLKKNLETIIDEMIYNYKKELLHFRSHFDIPLSDEECIKAPFYKPHKDSEEIKYLLKRRKKMGGFVPQRSNSSNQLKIPDLDLFNEILDGSNNREFSTTMSFVRILSILCSNDKIGKYIVPIIPDEARTFGIDPLFRKIGMIYVEIYFINLAECLSGTFRLKGQALVC